jgi:thiamine biosynthesis lipoprotein
MNDHAFSAMTCDIRILGARDAHALEAEVHDFAERLTRFDATSELSRLNADPREAVPASGLLRDAIRAALWAAARTGGLVDPALCGEIEAAGYERTLPPGELRLDVAPPRRPARARDTWRQVRLRGDCVVRPPGLRLDLGGTAKGLLADRLRGATAVDCGGDIRTRVPIAVDVIHPLTRAPAARVEVHGGIATSGIDRRCWEGGHHLLDPSTGRPAWTGLVGATALAPTALEAEALAKAALLSGPDGGRAWLASHGGFLFHDDGEVERV